MRASKRKHKRRHLELAPTRDLYGYFLLGELNTAIRDFSKDLDVADIKVRRLLDPRRGQTNLWQKRASFLARKGLRKRMVRVVKWHLHQIQPVRFMSESEHRNQSEADALLFRLEILIRQASQYDRMFSAKIYAGKGLGWRQIRSLGWVAAIALVVGGIIVWSLLHETTAWSLAQGDRLAGLSRTYLIPMLAPGVAFFAAMLLGWDRIQDWLRHEETDVEGTRGDTPKGGM